MIANSIKEITQIYEKLGYPDKVHLGSRRILVDAHHKDELCIESFNLISEVIILVHLENILGFTLDNAGFHCFDAPIPHECFREDNFEKDDVELILSYGKSLLKMDEDFYNKAKIINNLM